MRTFCIIWLNTQNVICGRYFKTNLVPRLLVLTLVPLRSSEVRASERRAWVRGCFETFFNISCAGMAPTSFPGSFLYKQQPRRQDDDVIMHKIFKFFYFQQVPCCAFLFLILGAGNLVTLIYVVKQKAKAHLKST
jgi:hypothetical protein